ncbi:MAG TPA: lipopolysaccharide biosynthesis protein [Candidatus Angelobacter sp.]|nr:lipopolysaccharide biosynthesis protein [Candidatus Angelobacter sp.]
MIPFDARGAFHPVAEGSELRRIAVRSAGATISGTGATTAIQVASTVVLSRLLAPADFGIVAMVTTFSLLLSNFGLNGFTEAVIQCKEIDRRTASNLFWINLGAGLVLAGAFAASGSLLAQFYRNPLVANAAVGTSVAILVSKGGVIHLALLRRGMRFAAVSANLAVARGANAIITILLALLGWRYWALVAGLVAQQLSMAVGAWWLCRWLPSWPKRTGRTGPVIRFAASTYGLFCFKYATQNVDNLLVGWQFNAIALGFYKRAYDLFVLSQNELVGPLHNVALATFSRLNHDQVRFKRYLVSSLAMLAFVGMAVGADMALVGRDFIRLVLGPQWGEAGKIFSFFGPGIGIMLLYSTTGWIHLSIGKPNRWLRWSIFEFCVTVLLFVLALRWGPEGIAAAWSVSFWLLIIPAFWYAAKPIRLQVSLLISAVWKYALASLLTAAACVALTRKLLPIPSTATAVGALEHMVFTSGLFLALYLGAVIVLHRGVGPLRQLANLLRELGPKGRSAHRTDISLATAAATAPAAVAGRTLGVSATENAPLALQTRQPERQET